jgi:carboxyl-terminal processing protease
LEQVEPSGPAAASGLRAGERLLAVDGQSVQDADVDTITGMLIGPEGTPVTLTLRNAAGRQHEVTLLRTLAPPLSVRAERRGDVLVLRIGLFAGDTGVRLAALLLDGMAAANPPHGLLIDLRGNRGGLLHQAVAAAETLLADGVIATTAGRDPAAAHAFVAHGTDLAGGLPAVVMVDGRSASAAEILAAALADQHRAVVLGSVTLGKGLVQTIAGLPDGGELLISWSRVLAPLGCRRSARASAPKPRCARSPNSGAVSSRWRARSPATARNARRFRRPRRWKRAASVPPPRAARWIRRRRRRCCTIPPPTMPPCSARRRRARTPRVRRAPPNDHGARCYGASRIATARVQPAEAALIFTGKHETTKPSAGNCSRLCSFSMWQ